MLGFTIESEGVRSRLVFRLSDNERVDVFGSGMLNENCISGVLPVVFNDHNGMQEIMFDITSKVSLDVFLKKSIVRHRLLSVFNGIINVIKQTSEYLMDTDLFVLEPAYIFVVPGTLSVEMIYLPVVRDEIWRLNERVRMLFKNTMFSARFSIEEDSRYITAILNALNNEKAFSLSAFSALLMQLMVEDYTIETKAELEPEIDNDTIQAEDQLIKRTLYNNDNSGEHESVKQALNKHVSDERSFVYWIKTVFHSFHKEKPSLDEKSEFNSDTLLDEDIVVKEPQKYTYNDDIDETVMLVPSVSESGTPYLVRSSNKEKIGIDKPVFRIGKEVRYADYIITDNAAISRAHAELRMNNGICSVCDENSLNHTYINENEIESQIPVELHAGDVLRFADEEFIFYC